MKTSALSLVTVCLVVAAMAATTVAAVQPGDAMSVPAYYKHLMRAPAAITVPIAVAVKHSAPATVLDATCQSVSDPLSPKYGKYLSIAQIADMIAPSQQTLDQVTAWLVEDLHAEQVDVAVSRDFVRAVVSVEALEAHMGVEMHVYSTKHAIMARSPVHYTLPDHIRSLVDIVLGVCDFPPEPQTAEQDQAEASPASPPANLLPPMSPLVMFMVVTSDQVHGLLDQPCYNTTTKTWPLCGNDLNPVVELSLILEEDGLTNTTMVLNSTNVAFDGVGKLSFSVSAAKPYHYYNFYVAAVAKDGTKTSYSAMPFTNPPPGFKGVRATPVMTPAEIGELYSLPSVKARTTSGSANSQAVAEFGGQFYTPSDLTMYETTYDLPTGTPVTLVGPNNPAMPGDESTMDIQLIMGVAPGVPTTFWSVKQGTSLAGSFILEWALQMANDTGAPLVTSISYGVPEDYVVAHFPDAQTYFARTNVEFMKLCARGLSVLICAQDAGSTDDGHGSSSCAIQPVFPATSPYCTAIGSTIQCPECPHRSNTPVGEAAISLQTGAIWTTGGGFSDAAVNRIPWYQKYAVDNYLNKYKDLLPTAPFNHTGRGYPDLASIGTNYAVVENGIFSDRGDGTSSSTPVWSGVISLLNNARLAAGKPALGFVNPLMYHIASTHPEALYDVTVGQNNCGAFLCCPDDVAFKTAPGWDPVTGLGSPGNFTLLQELVLSM